MLGLFLDASLTRNGTSMGTIYDPTPRVTVLYEWKAIVQKYVITYRTGELGRVLINRAFVWELEACPLSAVLQT